MIAIQVRAIMKKELSSRVVPIPNRVNENSPLPTHQDPQEEKGESSACVEQVNLLTVRPAPSGDIHSIALEIVLSQSSVCRIFQPSAFLS